MSTKRALLIWGGPVFADTPSKVHWPEGWSVDVIPITGNGSSYFGQVAAQYRGPDGHILPNIVASKGKSLASYDKVVLAGFSAFHGLANEILRADTDMVDAMISLDSCFSAISSPRKEGYARFASKAARGSALFLLTIGPGGGVGSGATLGPGGVDFSSAYDCVMQSVAGHWLREFDPPSSLPRPDSAKRSGDLIVLDYRKFRHDQHINELGVPIMQSYIVPWLESGGSLPWGDIATGAIIVASLGAIGWALWG